jgi:hypothetical protein
MSTWVAAEPKFVCDMTNPTPPSLCAEHYKGYPGLIQQCIQQEVDALNFINENPIKAPDDVLEDCGRAGCQAGYNKLQTVAECVKSLMSLKPRK